MIGQTISYYKILEKLGEGGMGVVYKAQDTKLERVVALKFLSHRLTGSDAERARFFQEAKAASALNHPNVCTIFDLQESEGQTFIVMEFVDGVTLRDKTEHATVPIPLKDVISYATQIGEALQEAHSQGIVHRDIKTDNIMVNKKNQAKVMDFGLAKLRGSLRVSQTSSTAGTLSYMPPEQLQGGAVDARSDIFSFGVVVYEMLSSRLPFRGEHEAAIMYSIVNEEPEPMQTYRQDVPADLERIVLRALEKDPGDRYQHVDDMVSELRRLQKQTTRVSKPATEQLTSAQKGQSGTRPGQPETGANLHESSKARRFPVVALGFVLALIAVIVALYVLVLRPKAAITSMAVLPFVNVGADPNTEYLSDGFTENLINTLSKLPGIKMMSRSSVFRFKGKDADPQRAGQELGVGAVLTGRILQRGDELSISTELINVQDNSHIWGEQYNRRISDIIGLQSDISREISGQLRVTLTGEQQKQIVTPATRNTEAYQLFLKGRFSLNRRNKEGFEKGIEFFQQAIQKDPSYAQAYAGLADAYGLLGSYLFIVPREAEEKAHAAAQKALELDPSLGEAHAILASVSEIFRWDWEDAERQYKKAIELSPNYATGHQWYGEFLGLVGRPEEGIVELRKAQELDPLAPIMYAALGEVLHNIRRHEESVQQFKKALEIDPNFSRALSGLGIAHLRQGMPELAIREIEQAITLSDSSLEFLGSLGYAYGVIGEKRKAQEILDHLKKLSPRRYLSPGIVAIVCIGIGDNDQAFVWLNRALEAHDPALEYLKVDPFFDSLRGDPRFTELLKKVGLPL